MGESQLNSAYNLLTAAAFHLGTPLPDTMKSAIGNMYNAEGREKVYEFAAKKKILPFVAVCLEGLNIDVEHWGNVAEIYRKRNESVIACLDKVFSAFREVGAKKVFVTENFGALLAAGGDLALFASGDVDIYADPSEKEIIYDALSQLSFSIEERYSLQQLINTTFQNNELLPNGFHLSIAWHPLSRMKLPCFVSADRFINWGKLLNYRESAIQLPDIESLAYICLLHISLHSFARAPDIRLYTDVYNVLKLQIDWEKILIFAKQDKTVVRVATAFTIAERVVGVKIPENIRLYFLYYEKKIARLLRHVYDEKQNTLLYEPNGLRLLWIEASCDDRGPLSGLLKIIFPERNWIQQCYLKNDQPLVVGYFRHIKNLIG